ncbi:type IV-A pilus assembly ATPase PilB [Halomonas almeriensis]|uniref:type IV-A pilus assembly ATPase PilB n=1 Tax=Halomonas almeriensis TaxID=308163 RepID=UPI0025B48B55|nr:type IV-A pilus assembly ATPase PilB [Halomonas almeriensis]MDN3553075.1 type IV-A pilus assembly ATPase PilB [Halomonas almeriensis]
MSPDSRPQDSRPGEGLPAQPPGGLANRLIEEGLLSFEEVWRLDRQAGVNGVSLLQHLVATQSLSPWQVAEAAGREYELTVIDLNQVDINSLPRLEDASCALLRRLQALPLQRDDKRLKVAISHPGQMAALGELRFASGLSVETVLAPLDQLEHCLERYLAGHSNTRQAMDRIDTGSHSFSIEEDTVSAVESDTDGPLVDFVDSLLQDAISQGASDIHFEPYATRFRIRQRIDGILHDMAQPPPGLHARVTARLKVMARLDISERRLPQDGAIKWHARHGSGVDFRVNTLPTVHGEKVVLRLLDPATACWRMDQLGLSDTQHALVESALAHPQGMILVTGPTGSGKTVTLYTALRQLNDCHRNICTAEDPVEIKLEGINQVNVLPRIGLDFASTLRAFLRQDPDVVMVGEIRDPETAEIAIKAAQTGHLVLSTLHTNSAVHTLTRLTDMGVAPFNVSGSVSLIVAQRLARRLCDRCKRAVSVSEARRSQLECHGADTENLTLFEPVGCHECQAGFRGRIGLYEVVPIDASIRTRILRRAKAADLEQQARENGYLSLRQSGIEKVLQGLTSLDEVNRITGHT